MAALAYVYYNPQRELAKRLAKSSHDHHNLSVATMHIHLDHSCCMEVALLRGAMHDVRDFAGYVIAERGSLLWSRWNLRIRRMHMVPSRPAPS